MSRNAWNDGGSKPERPATDPAPPADDAARIREIDQVTAMAVIASLRWTGDGYEWAPPTRDYREDPLYALRVMVGEYTAALAAANRRAEAAERVCRALRQWYATPGPAASNWDEVVKELEDAYAAWKELGK